MYIYPNPNAGGAPEDNISRWETDPSLIQFQYLMFMNSIRVRGGADASATDGLSLPVGSDQVSARLYNIAIRGSRPVGNLFLPPGSNSPFFIPPSTEASSSSSSASFSCASPPSSPSIPFISLLPGEFHNPVWKRQIILDFERSCYHKIVDDGGRPWYSIDLLVEVSNNPKRFANVLKFWQGELAHLNQEWWPVFGAQLERWRDFRRHQVVMRHEHKNAFQQYHQRVTNRLTKHDISIDSIPINLIMKIGQQDKLTTWMEYLSFELSLYETYRWYLHWDEEYYEHWESLLETNVLKSYETREYIESTDYRLISEVEAMRARKVVEASRSRVLVAQRDLLDPARKGSGAYVKLREAELELNAVCTDFDRQKQRARRIADFLGATVEYRVARRRAHRLTTLLTWIREQVPLIRCEMNMEEEAHRADEDRENQDPTQVLTSIEYEEGGVDMATPASTAFVLTCDDFDTPELTRHVPAAIEYEDALIDMATPASTAFLLGCDDISTREGSLALATDVGGGDGDEDGDGDGNGGGVSFPSVAPSMPAPPYSPSQETQQTEGASSPTTCSGGSKRSRSDDGTEVGTEDQESKRPKGNSQSPTPSEQAEDGSVEEAVSDLTSPDSRPRRALNYANRLVGVPGSDYLECLQAWAEGQDHILEQYGNLRERPQGDGEREQ